MAKIEVEDIDRDDLDQFCIGFAFVLMFGDDSGSTVEHPLHVIKFARKLHFDNDDFFLAVFYLENNALEFIASVLLVAFAFENFKDKNIFTQRRSLKKPSRISKLALLRSRSFIAQSKVISFQGDRGFMTLQFADYKWNIFRRRRRAYD